ncbi:hypothetical protein PGIGA_G00074500 [Pangasianodon gigas]|uniref:Uncharacterized protein n=1 Tax=Pangasianodon gigas TaxID=30993 RepID=A0ACC5X801_PANGG|nr:hypothetical protein [Pangasianodon gigas]
MLLLASEGPGFGTLYLTTSSGFSYLWKKEHLATRVISFVTNSREIRCVAALLACTTSCCSSKSIRPPMMSYAEKPEDITRDEWMEKLNNVHVQRADMNRLIMNYLVTEGFKEAAEKFRLESGIEPSVDLDSLDERIKIREMILKGQIQEAIALINSLHPELLDTNRYLYFHLQQQHLIELIRLRETEAALEFAQTQLAEQGEESRECLSEMERTLALLAFDNPEDSPFGDLLNMMQRQKVWSEVNQAVLDYENRESTPKLAKLLKLLLWAQNELDQKKVKYPKMTDLSKGTIEDPK